MRLPGENEERDARLSMKYMIMGVSLAILLILGVVVYTNKQEEERRRQHRRQDTTVMALDHEKGQDGSTEGEEEGVTDGYAGRKSLQEGERLYEENKLRASDLDCWDM